MCSPTTEEKSLSLIRDINCVIAGAIDVKILTLTLATVNLEQRKDPRSNVVSKYFQDQLERNPDTCLLGIWAYNENRQTDFSLELRKDWMRELCRLLPEPFLRLRGTLALDIDGGTCDESPIEFEKCLKFNDSLLKTSGWGGNLSNTQHDNILVSNPFPNSASLTCVMSIDLGWLEPKEAAQICAHSLLEKMLEDEATKDLTLVAGNGAEIKCHRVVFAIHSPAFSAMLSPKTGMRESRSKRADLKENSEEGLLHLVNYLYGLELVFNNMASELAVELFQTAHKYGLSQLENSLLEVLLKKDVEFFTPDAILELYFYVRNSEVIWMRKLRDHSLHLLATLDTEELRSCAEFKKLDPVEIADLSFKIIKFAQKFMPRATAPDDEATGPSGIKRKKMN